MYKIHSYQGFNDIKFGFTSAEVERCMGVKPSDKFKKHANDKFETDMYQDFFVYYDDVGRCEAVEFFDNAELMFGDISFFDKMNDELEAIFKVLDGELMIDSDGFTSHKFGIGVYVPYKEDKDATVEAVIIFKQKYYG